jgi:hypothetical protein
VIRAVHSAIVESGFSRTGALLTIIAIAMFGVDAAAQRGQGPPAPRTPREAAPFDLTGNWVSVVTEDWRWRMVVPKKGDYSSVPLNEAGRKAADAWDPSKTAADGCRAYGAAAIMRVPGRLRISWEGDATLKIETDAGLQTRSLRFDSTQKPALERTWQGQSTAAWDQIRSPGGLGVSLQTAPPRAGALKVVTTNVRAGYLRRNGVPYSEDAVVTEYFDRLRAYDTDWLTVLTIVEDPRYLNQPFITSTHFKREPDASKWAPTPCEAPGAT